MYKKPFQITKKAGNNKLSFKRRKNLELYVPSLKKIQSLDEIKLLSPDEWKITFEDYDFDDRLQTCYGLENIYELSLSWILSPLKGNRGLPEEKETTKDTPVYLVDNHNHVFYFWYLARSQGIISDNALLYHIDEHADTRDPGEYLLKPDSEDLGKVFEYTNFTLNVGNYIIPAQKEGLIWDVVQMRGEEALREYISHPWILSLNTHGRKQRSIILNLDLDFFEPELDFIDYDLKKQVILDIAKRADLITICTSPFFIDQERAVEVLKDIFY